MIKATSSRPHEAPERGALRRRVKQMYDLFNLGSGEECFALIDPRLREASKVDLPAYMEGLQACREAHGIISPWYIRISLHLNPAASQRDPRPFAYVYVVWQDSARGFHMFRERWVKEAGHWYTH